MIVLRSTGFQAQSSGSQISCGSRKVLPDFLDIRECFPVGRGGAADGHDAGGTNVGGG